jgi:hypothetical protein
MAMHRLLLIWRLWRQQWCHRLGHLTAKDGSHYVFIHLNILIIITQRWHLLLAAILLRACREPAGL